MNGKTASVILLLALAAWVITRNPVASGHAVHGVGTLITTAVQGLSNFARNA